MDIVKNSKEQWVWEQSPQDFIEAMMRRRMRLDETDFPNISIEETYNKLKADPKFRKQVNEFYIKHYGHPANDAEFDSMLKDALNIGEEPKKKIKLNKNNYLEGTQMPRGTWEDVLWY